MGSLPLNCTFHFFIGSIGSRCIPLTTHPSSFSFCIIVVSGCCVCSRSPRPGTWSITIHWTTLFALLAAEMIRYVPSLDPPVKRTASIASAVGPKSFTDSRSLILWIFLTPNPTSSLFLFFVDLFLIFSKMYMKICFSIPLGPGCE